MAVREAVLYIAASLDGYIADRGGGVDWLSGQGDAGEPEDSYSAFVQDMDTVVMGWNTYHQVVTELSPGKWVYSALKSYVVTHREVPPAENIQFVGETPCDLIRRLRQEPGRGIWICGGAKIIQPLVEADLIDRYHISVIPTLLGSGIRLWGGTARELKLRLTRTRSYDGITELVYTRR